MEGSDIAAVRADPPRVLGEDALGEVVASERQGGD
jgi:hypothetical protein